MSIRVRKSVFLCVELIRIKAFVTSYSICNKEIKVIENIINAQYL